MSNVKTQDPQTLEQLSAFCDGELERHEARFLLRRLEHDQPLRDCYDRYVGIGIALRREARLGGAGFADAVMARIDLEVPRGARVPGWMRAAAGGAIAAGVAAVSLFMVSPPRTDGPASVPTLAATTSLRASDLGGAVVPVERVTERQSFSVPLNMPASAVNARVESYFLRHSGASWSAARGGYVPYVYVVATPRGAEATQGSAAANR